MPQPNVQSVVHEWLTTSGSSLYALCAGRVWHSAYPDIADWAEDTAGIVFTFPATTTPANGQTEDVTVEFRCHGADRTYSAAQAVARALYDLLHNKGVAVTGGSVHKALRKGNQDLADPDTGWPFTLSRYVMSIEN